MSKAISTPVLFLIYNRPDLSWKVFQQIRAARPVNFFIAADGPRIYKEGDEDKCKKTRDLILKNIDWECTVSTLFRETNLGCKMAVGTAITWFFNHVEEGIIFEDDTIPDESFFDFCETMLERYRSNHSVMHIGGSNFQLGTLRGDGDYYYSNYVHVWGWATWRRAWAHYHTSLQEWEFFKTNPLEKICNGNEQQIKFWRSFLQNMYDNKLDSWATQWHFTVWVKKGKAIIPNTNLIKNIGFGTDATHTRTVNEFIEKITLGHLQMFNQPTKKLIQKDADDFTFNNFYYQAPQPKKNIAIRVVRKILKILTGIKN